MNAQQKLLTAAIVAALALSACGEAGPLRLPVQGEVTLDGEPLEAGRIRFVPAASRGVEGYAAIIAGEYRLSDDAGLPPGDYRVEVEGQVELGFALDDDIAFANRPKKPLPPPSVPERYRRDTPLEATVVAGQPNEFHFPLTTKESR
ncbi:MAG: hypothetical protein KF774_08480 [Planctomyces sp.]|nr:hypothetical protein [Planctomyces sp.]